MHPTLFELGSLTLHSYGVMLALSFLMGIYLASFRAKKRGVDVQFILDLSVYIILAAVVGSRLAYIIFHLSDYNSIVDMFALWQGGATLYGGLVLSVAVSLIFSLKRKISFWQLADIIAPSIALGIVFTRIGCFLSGCCFGAPTELPWGIVFPPISPAGIYARSLAMGSIALHPTQLYASLASLGIVLALLLLEGRFLKKPGSVFGLFLVLYGISRFSIDFFRFYESNMIAFGLSLNQVLSVVLFLFGIWLLARRARPA
jgi:phosphatidylglycerol:prolipoprotein diacylglycerol transferase